MRQGRPAGAGLPPTGKGAGSGLSSTPKAEAPVFDAARIQARMGGGPALGSTTPRPGPRTCAQHAPPRARLQKLPVFDAARIQARMGGGPALGSTTPRPGPGPVPNGSKGAPAEAPVFDTARTQARMGGGPALGSTTPRPGPGPVSNGSKGAPAEAPVFDAARIQARLGGGPAVGGTTPHPGPGSAPSRPPSATPSRPKAVGFHPDTGNPASSPPRRPAGGGLQRMGSFRKGGPKLFDWEALDEELLKVPEEFKDPRFDSLTHVLSILGSVNAERLLETVRAGLHGGATLCIACMLPGTAWGTRVCGWCYGYSKLQPSCITRPSWKG